VLANRLKQILPEIISEEQSAFVSGWLITDNVITAYECLHFMKNNRSKRNGHCALKLNMKKAYDRLEWSYLEEIMKKLGLSHKFLDTVMRGDFLANQQKSSSLVEGCGRETLYLHTSSS
jgi:hypothetical protein